MIRLSSLLFCVALGLGGALVSCSSDSSSGGGAGGAMLGTGGAMLGTGGAMLGTGGAIVGVGGAVVGVGGAVVGVGGAVVGVGGAVVAGTGGAGIDAGGGGIGGTEAVLAILPGDNTISTWVRDPSESTLAGKPAALALDYKTAVDLIDGGADPFYTNLFKPDVFAWQNYMNPAVKPQDGSDAYLARMYLMQMPDAAQATMLYESLLDGTHSLYSATLDPWDKTLALGDAARIVNSGTEWWINLRKGVYYLEMFLGYAEREDMAAKQLAIDFATAIVAKM